MMNTLEAAKLGQSHAERRFVLDALSAGLRADGRRPLDSRRVRLHFARAHAQSSCEVQLGRSRVRCVCSGEVAAPRPGRPTEGSIAFKTTMSPMASAAFSSMSARDLASHPVAVAIGTVVERAVRDSRTVDVETLCIISGSRVWSLSLDLQVRAWLWWEETDREKEKGCCEASFASLTLPRRLNTNAKAP